MLVLIAGCDRRPSAPESKPAGVAVHEFTDDTGRRVVVPAAPQRIISLAPNLTEILFALGLGDRVVGVTRYCDFPQAAKEKEQVGDTLRPDLERIIALKPDLVLITTSSQLENLNRQLDRMSIPAFVTNPRTVRDVVASIKKLGAVTGVPAKGDEIARDMERRIEETERRAQSTPKVRVFYVLQVNPLITAGRNTFINDLIQLAGGVSISGDEATDYPQYSRETVIARAPEIIVAPGVHGTELVSVKDLQRDFATTPAIRANRIVRVNPDWVDRPGPRIVDGLEQLAKGLHPE
jgi:iron complex transport system substrate-binding protein